MAQFNMELLDVVQNASPNLRNIDPVKTAKKIQKIRSSIKNYNMAISPIGNIVTGLQRLEDLEAYWETHQIEDWRKPLKEVGTRIFQIFGSEVSKWYPTGRKPIPSVAGLRVKPAIRGVRVLRGLATPCLINPRATILLRTGDSLPFVARGVYELHVRDEVSVLNSMIVDLGQDPRTGLRANRVYYPEEKDMMSVEEFESILQKFNEAIRIAGFVAPELSSALDMFRPR